MAGQGIVWWQAEQQRQQAGQSLALHCLCILQPLLHFGGCHSKWRQMLYSAPCSARAIVQNDINQSCHCVGIGHEPYRLLALQGGTVSHHTRFVTEA